MSTAYPSILAFVQHLTPTWGKWQHTNFAHLVDALIERGNLAITDLVRAMPRPTQTLHGRHKRLGRFLKNPRLDEPVLFLNWLRLAYRFSDDLSRASDGRPMLPLLLDTVYFEPFALLVVTVPCGSRGLPAVLTTYHRYELEACFPPESTWPSPDTLPARPSRDKSVVIAPIKRASSLVSKFDSQNKIEQHLIHYTFHLVSPALMGVIVADRGFARAALFIYLIEHKRAFAIRIDAQTHIRVPEPLAPGLPVCGPPEQVLGLRRGQRIWCTRAWYSQEDQVPISLLAIWDSDQKEPWYIATSLETAEQTETIYRWRMRLECANRDEKTGVILREGGDQHSLKNVLHMHRLHLALLTGEWLCGLTGLQAWHDLPEQSAVNSPPQLPLALPAPVQPLLLAPPRSSLPAPEHPQAVAPVPVLTPTSPTPTVAQSSSPALVPEWANDPAILDQGPSQPPPVLPHRGPTPKLPGWLRCFAARGWLSYVRLGREILCSADFHHILQRMVRWLAHYLWPTTPLWRRYQLRYRILHWWTTSPGRSPPN